MSLSLTDACSFVRVHDSHRVKGETKRDPNDVPYGAIHFCLWVGMRVSCKFSRETTMRKCWTYLFRLTHERANHLFVQLCKGPVVEPQKISRADQCQGD